MKNSKSITNLNYNDASHYLGIKHEMGSIDWYQAIKKAGYTFAYRWISSDTEWMFFATSHEAACEGAAQLYAQEKKTDMATARKYYDESVDVYSFDEIIEEF